ncbi:MAG: acyltransferase family protein [Spirochaetales bacterium]|nr:acyltransferase family protein [Spirochaetales bacterium]
MSNIQTDRTETGGPPKREYYLDWIRNIIVLILIPFHTAVSFSHIGKGYVYTAEPVDSYFYVFISDFFNLWIMRLLFFVSGFSVLHSLKKRRIGDFLKDRIKRLVIPVLFQLLTLGPVSGYILAVSRYGFSGSFLNYYPHFFTEARKYLFWGHMWYCVYLFIFSLLYLPLFSFLMKRTELVEGANRFLLRKNNIFLPMALIVLFEALLRPLYPGYQSFIGDWANVAVHSSFFLLGFIVAQSPELSDSLTRRIGQFLFLAVSSSILYLMCKRFLFRRETPLRLIVLSSLWGIAAYTWVIALTGVFRKYLNKNSPLLTYLSRTSFSLYLFHYLILSTFNYFLIGTGIPHYAVWLSTSVGTYVTFAALFELVIRRWGILRQVCGIGYKDNLPRGT